LLQKLTPQLKQSRLDAKTAFSSSLGNNEQLYSSASDGEKNKQKTIYNKHQNAIDMQDYQAVTCV